MADPKKARYGDHEEHFRQHFRKTYGKDESHVYRDYEPAYRSGFRYGAAREHEGRSFGDLEPEMRRRYEEKHGEGTWQTVNGAARHAFQRGRSLRGEDARPGSPSGSGETASGDPGSVMREEEGKGRSSKRRGT